MNKDEAKLRALMDRIKKDLNLEIELVWKTPVHMMIRYLSGLSEYKRRIMGYDYPYPIRKEVIMDSSSIDDEILSETELEAFLMAEVLEDIGKVPVGWFGKPLCEEIYENALKELDDMIDSM